MSLQVVFELSELDLEHLRTMMEDARKAAANMDEQKVLEAARKNVPDESSLPEFIELRLRKLDTLIRMVGDDEWKLSGEDRERVISAIGYFAVADDLIPDRIPGLGFLDDAIMIELVARDLKPEIDAYEDFCLFRDAEVQRRAARGEPTDVGREAWLADRRATLHSRMRSRRERAARGGSWRLSTW